MAKKKWGIQFSGFAEMVQKLDATLDELKDITSECLEVAPEMIAPKLHEAMKEHRRSGKTEGSIIEKGEVEWEGLVGKIGVGFKIGNGGFPSIFLMYGTPRHEPRNQYGGPKRENAKMHQGVDADKDLYNAVYGAAMRKKIAAKQEEILRKRIAEKMGG